VAPDKPPIPELTTGGSHPLAWPHLYKDIFFLDDLSSLELREQRSEREGCENALKLHALSKLNNKTSLSHLGEFFSLGPSGIFS
jgi:hypothetical protein